MDDQADASLAEKQAAFAAANLWTHDPADDEAEGEARGDARQKSWTFFRARDAPAVEDVVDEDDDLVEATVLPTEGAQDTSVPDVATAPAAPAAPAAHAVTALPKRRTPGRPPSRTDPPPRATKKRKSSVPSQAAVAAPRIFEGLFFFYVPDNDVAPARRIRITKAREHGAAWTRSITVATHVVVDRALRYSDVEPLLPAGTAPIVVDEDYPLECIQFGRLLDPRQSKYRVAGQAAPQTAPEPQDKPVRSDSLEIKARQPRQRSPTAPTSTPARDEHEVAATQTGPGADDELSRYISMMQEYRNLPLEDDEDGSASDDTADAPPPRKRAEVFACQRGGTKDDDADANNPNGRTIEILQRMASYYDQTDDTWRSMAYRRAMATLRRQTRRVSTEEEAVQLPGIGQRLAQKIEEITTTDRLRRLEYAEAEPAGVALRLFTGIYGVGVRQAQRWVTQGHRTLEDLRSDPTVRLSTNQTLGVEHYDDLASRIPRAEVEALAAVVKSAAALVDPAVRVVVGGSYRRGAQSSHDIDLLVTKTGTTEAADLADFLEDLISRLWRDGFLVARLASSSATTGSGSKWHGCCVLPEEGEGPAVVDRNVQGTSEGSRSRSRPWRRIDFLLVPETELGAALIYFTGNDLFNRSMRLLASRKGMRLNQRGLYSDVMRGAGRAKLAEGRLVEGRDERRIFDLLGVQWREPHERWC